MGQIIHWNTNLCMLGITCLPRAQLIFICETNTENSKQIAVRGLHIHIGFDQKSLTKKNLTCSLSSVNQGFSNLPIGKHRWCFNIIPVLANPATVVTFMINRDSLINYHRTLNNLFEEELMKNEKIQTIIFSSLRTIYTLAYTYFAILVIVIFAFFGSSYIFIIHNLLYLHLSTNYTLPLSRGVGWFWPIPHNFLYHLHLFYETSLIILSTMTACGVDSVFGFYVYQFSSTIRAMTFTLTNPLSTEKFSDILRTCVVKHQKLLQCRKTLEHIYGPIVFWHIVTNAMLLCSLMYDLISVYYNFYNVSASLVYAVIKLLQTFIYAWHGTFLTNAGEDFRKGIYFGKWPNSSLDRHVRTNVILIMMQKPMTVNAFFSPVDVIMFTNVSISIIIQFNKKKHHNRLVIFYTYSFGLSEYKSGFQIVPLTYNFEKFSVNL
ncbi:Putative odorant receptor 49a [Trachymyrmex zeteki]|uniref:Odorant receptor n=1 Tax=Mycetomoellerius zeteki TaxID=64791 RepID=A0A151WGK5_9HYME|nr:Putative odorant receptor 49a [Trachymyrmex zeteki]